MLSLYVYYSCHYTPAIPITSNGLTVILACQSALQTTFRLSLWLSAASQPYLHHHLRSADHLSDCRFSSQQQLSHTDHHIALPVAVKTFPTIMRPRIANVPNIY